MIEMELESSRTCLYIEDFTLSFEAPENEVIVYLATQKGTAQNHVH